MNELRICVSDLRCWIDCFVTEHAGSNHTHEKKVLVELIDYGIVEAVRLRNILPLRKKYLEFPMQVFRGKLNGKRIWNRSTDLN